MVPLPILVLATVPRATSAGVLPAATDTRRNGISEVPVPPVRMLRPLAAAFVMAVAGASAATAFVYDEFEVFAPPSGEVGTFEVDQHVNYGLRGRRVLEYPRALPPRGGTFLNTEISYGVLPWYTLSLELPAAVTRDGRLHDGGFKLRNIVAIAGSAAWSYGVLLEAQRQPHGFLPHPWGIVASPLVAWRSGAWEAVLNTGFGMSFGARGATAVVAPAARLGYALRDDLAIGAEYYGDLDQAGRWSELPRQGHQLLAVTRIGLGPAGLRLGLGRGLTAASDRWVGTVVVGFEF